MRDFVLALLALMLSSAAVAQDGESAGATIRKLTSHERWDLAQVEAAFYSEPVDRSWASRTEAYIRTRLRDADVELADNFAFEIECRTTVCRVYWVPASANAFQTVGYRVLNRLDAASIAIMDDQEDEVRPLGIHMLPPNSPRYPLIVHFLVRDTVG